MHTRRTSILLLALQEYLHVSSDILVYLGFITAGFVCQPLALKTDTTLAEPTATYHQFNITIYLEML